MQSAGIVEMWLFEIVTEWQAVFGKREMVVPLFRIAIAGFVMLVCVCKWWAARGMVKKLKNYEQKLVFSSDM